MQAETSSPRTDMLFTLKLIWGAFVFSGVLYAVLLSFLIKMKHLESLPITQFSQIMQRPDFMIAVVIGFILVTVSRLLPKILLRSQLKKNKNAGKQQIIQGYFLGFILGLACLELLALLGFYLAFQYGFMPVYWVFGFVSIANMLIRFPTWAYIKFLAEGLLGKPIVF